MIRLALDRSAVASSGARTGIARYIGNLATALRSTPGIELLESAGLNLWSGLRGPGAGGQAGGIGGAIREYVTLPGTLQRHAIDVYHVPGSRAPGRAIPVPLVVTIHDLAAYEFPDLQGRRRGRQLRGQLAEALVKATLIVTPSASVRAEIAMRFPASLAKIRVIHHGVSEVFRVARAGPGSSTFVSIATLERRKNLSNLIDAFAQVVAQRPAARLRLIGQAENDLAAVRERVSRHRLENAVSVEGHISDEAVVAAYQSAVATVYPSLYEGFGLPLIESMATGTPVITGDLNVTREVAQEAAMFVDPADCGAIAKAMVRVLDDAPLRQSLSEAGIRRAANFTWERSAHEHADVYHEAVELAGKKRTR